MPAPETPTVTPPQGSGVAVGSIEYAGLRDTATMFAARAHPAVQDAPFSVKPYGARFLPCQVPMNPNDRVPCAATVLL